MVAKIFTWLLRMLRYTWRVHFINTEDMERLYSGNKQFVVCFWHGKYVPVFPLLEGYHATVISNQSARGHIIAEIRHGFGYQAALLPDKAGRESLAVMSDILTHARIVATPVDGPLGPRHKVKTGVLRKAADFGFVLLPVSVGSRGKIILKKHWDKMEIPLPFSRVYLMFGEPIHLPSVIHPDELPDWAEKATIKITNLDDHIKVMMRDS